MYKFAPNFFRIKLITYGEIIILKTEVRLCLIVLLIANLNLFNTLVSFFIKVSIKFYLLTIFGMNNFDNER